MKRLNYKNIFRLSNGAIFVISLFIGTLASVPKILRLEVEFGELLLDISISMLFTLFAWYFNLYFLPQGQKKHQSLRRIGLHLLKSFVAGAVVMFLFVLVHQLIFSKYHLKSMLTMYEFRGLVINLTIHLFLYLLYQNYVASCMSVELEKTKTDKLNTQFELLKQQVNPHFLFNNLNTLKSMVEMNDKNATHFIVMLSDFYRFVLERKSGHLVSLENELKTLQAYVFLLESRFEEGLRLKIAISQEEQNSLMPPFTLQLLIENCIKHNIVSFEKPLHINVFSSNGFLVIENNLQLKRSTEKSTGTGIKNIKQRYWQLFDRHIYVIQTDTFFQIKLPLIYGNSHH